MARTYRFFTRHLIKESLPQNSENPFNLSEGLEPEIFHQLTKVLRVKAGDIVVLLPPEQSPPYFEFEYTVETTGKKDLALRFTVSRQNTNELDFKLGLILCLPNKPDKLEFIIQKAVEIGVCRVILTGADFSQMRHGLRPDRLRKIIMEAAEQSERAAIPELLEAGHLRTFLESPGAQKYGEIFVALERQGQSQSIGSLMEDAKKREMAENTPVSVNILIGPEGGFSPQEIALIQALKLNCFSLGKRILRMETAAILSLGIASTS